MDERVSYDALAGLFLAQRRKAGETRRLLAAGTPSVPFVFTRPGTPPAPGGRDAESAAMRDPSIPSS
jgi:hypothetical protein